jgi:hypothetical protein
MILKATKPKWKFNPLNLFCSLSIVILFDSMFHIHDDTFTWFVFCFIVGTIFPPFNVIIEKPKE